MILIIYEISLKLVGSFVKYYPRLQTDIIPKKKKKQLFDFKFHLKIVRFFLYASHNFLNTTREN